MCAQNTAELEAVIAATPCCSGQQGAKRAPEQVCTLQQLGKPVQLRIVIVTAALAGRPADSQPHLYSHAKPLQLFPCSPVRDAQCVQLCQGLEHMAHGPAGLRLGVQCWALQGALAAQLHDQAGVQVTCA